MATPTADDSTPFLAQFKYEFSLLKRNASMRSLTNSVDCCWHGFSPLRPPLLQHVVLAGSLGTEACLVDPFFTRTYRVTLTRCDGRRGCNASRTADLITDTGDSAPIEVELAPCVDCCECCAWRRSGGVARAPRCWISVTDLGIDATVGKHSTDDALRRPTAAVSGVIRIIVHTRSDRGAMSMSTHASKHRRCDWGLIADPDHHHRRVLITPVKVRSSKIWNVPYLVDLKAGTANKPNQTVRGNESSMRATSEFLLREAVALLLDDPSPHNIARAVGDAPTPLSMESQTEGTEDSESQLAFLPATSSRVMMVRSTKSAEQLVTLVDRSFSIEAYVSSSLIEELRERHRYKSLSRLRGSVIRVDKYHFSTPSQCRALIQQNMPQKGESVSTRLARRGQTHLCLYIESLSVIDDQVLAVTPCPDLQDHEAIAKQLTALSPQALENWLMVRQGQGPVTLPASQPTVKQFDDQNPLLDEDCEIPEDQERELDEQDGWGDVDFGPTDSQLIEENGPVSGGDSQAGTSGHTVPSSGSNTVIASSNDSSRPSGERIIVAGTEDQLSASPVDDLSVPDSQAYPFQQANLKEAFVECDDSEDESEGEAKDDGENNVEDTEDGGDADIVEEYPRTQADDPSDSDDRPVNEVDATEPFSQAPGEFTGTVRDLVDEPMTQQDVESQGFAETQQADNSNHSDGDSASVRKESSDYVVDFEFGMPEDSPIESDDNAHARSSQQDGQEDHWMQTQPNESPKALRDTTRTTSATAAMDRRKRRRTLSPGHHARQPESPAKAARTRKSLSPRRAVSTRAASVDSPVREVLKSLLTGREVTVASVQARHRSFGIASVSAKSASTLRSSTARPSKKYQHLLPAFNYESIKQLLRDKNT